jgi:hypothetical protein
MLAHLTANDVGIGEIGAVFEGGFVASANLECLDTTLFTLSRIYRKRLTMHERARCSGGCVSRMKASA